MNRYNTPNRLSTDSGKKYYPTFRYPTIVEKTTDVYIIGSFSDRLDNLAFGCSSLWSDRNRVKGDFWGSVIGLVIRSSWLLAAEKLIIQILTIILYIEISNFTICAKHLNKYFFNYMYFSMQSSLFELNIID